MGRKKDLDLERGGWNFKRLLKAIRTSFCNSPHKKWYWTALVDAYAVKSSSRLTP
jgi:hypothetical protein